MALKGPVTTPVGGGFSSVNVGLRKALDLFANLRPVWNIPSIKSRYDGVDLVIVRENTEDLYSGLEHEVVPGRGREPQDHHRRTPRPRIARFAFEYARRHAPPAHHRGAQGQHHEDGRRPVPPLGADRSPATTPTSPATTASSTRRACSWSMNPTQFDVLLLPNLYGDIVSDLCAGLVGGLGVVPGANLGVDIGVFEAVHGSAPDIAGKNLANPTALLLSAVLMLRHIDESQIADRVTTALGAVLSDGTVRTRDLGGTATTGEFTDAIVRKLG